MNHVHYRIGTMAFPEETCPTWDSRSAQVLEQMAQWAREGWYVSRLNATSHIRLQARGFCILLERLVQQTVQVNHARIRGSIQ